jgi:hypothetical protein
MLKWSALIVYLTGLGVLLLWVPETLGSGAFRSLDFDFVWQQDVMRVQYSRVIYEIYLWTWACSILSALVIVCRRIVAHFRTGMGSR